MYKINSIIKIDEEQLDRLKSYVDFLLKYNEKMNLIGKSTIDDIWERHILDSLQIINLIKNKDIRLADLGSGAGLPGIPLSIVGITEVHLFEKSPKKCEFLEKAKLFSSNKIVVRNENINEVRDNSFDIITSRALADLNTLLKFSNNLKKDDTELIFLKGKKAQEELNEAQKQWNINYEMFNSVTSSEGKIIKITKFKS